jgi:hypothetical protein
MEDYCKERGLQGGETSLLDPFDGISRDELILIIKSQNSEIVDLKNKVGRLQDTNVSCNSKIAKLNAEINELNAALRMWMG